MNCKYCGAELLANTCFCVKCGKKNEESDSNNEVTKNGSIMDKADREDNSAKQEKGVASKEKRDLKKIIIPLTAIFLMIGIVIVLTIMPQKPKESQTAGSYNDCISVSFSTSKIVPVGKAADIYISVDGSEYSLYTGEDYYLNQSRTYDFKLYTINAAGIKSAETEFEYIMDIPVPADLEVSVRPGTYTDYQTVEILSEDGSCIYYTTDGTPPTEKSPLYDGGIKLDAGTTVIKAFAVNEAGTVGEVYEWEYELNLPIPSDVLYSVEGGVYYDTIQVELKSDTDAVIYYTLDGSDPTENSAVYSSPIELTNGIFSIKAIAMNGYNMFSETTTKQYVVTYNKYGENPKTALADGYYAVIGGAATLVKYDDQMNEVKSYNISNISAVYSDGESIYYLADGSLFKLDTDAEQGNKLIDMYIDEFSLASGKIYFTSSNILYSVDYSGGNLNKYDSFASCEIAGCWDDTIYLYDSGVAYKIVGNSDEIESVTQVDSDDYFIFDSSLYYISEGNLLRKNMEDGSLSTVIESTYNYYNLDPAIELLDVTDKSQTITVFCADIFVCHNILYVLVQTKNEVDVYHTVSEKTDRDINMYYEWYAVDLNLGNVNNTNINTQSISVFDNCIIDENGNVSTVVQ